MMTWMRILCLYLCIFSSLFLACFANADGLRVRHTLGGQATALQIADHYWYQALGDRLVVLRKQGGTQVATVMLTEQPAAASCTDLLLDGKVLYALLKNKEVVVLDLQSPKIPKVVRRFDADTLGIIPQGLVFVGAWPVVIGDGGAVRLSDARKIVQSDGPISSIAMSIDLGIVYVLEDLIIDADTRETLGAATTLVALDDSANADIGTFVYTRALDGETEIGLMKPSMQSIEANVVISGNQINIYVRGSRIYATTDEGVFVIGIASREVRLLRTFQVDGVQDVGIIASNYLAMCGNFGWGLYRIELDRGGNAQSLFRVTQANGMFSAGAYDHRGVAIPTEQGTLYYGFDESMKKLDTHVGIVSVPTQAIVLGWEASVDTTTGDVTIQSSSGVTKLQLPSVATTIVPISGNFWIATTDGIFVYGEGAEGELAPLGHVQIAGPVVQLIPLFDGSAAFVSESGFVGVVEQVQDTFALEQ